MSFLSLMRAFSRILMATFSFVSIWWAILTLPNVPFPRDLPTQLISVIRKEIWKSNFTFEFEFYPELTNYIVAQLGASGMGVRSFDCWSLSRDRISGLLRWGTRRFGTLSSVGSVGFIFRSINTFVVWISSTLTWLHFCRLVIRLTSQCCWVYCNSVCLLLVVIPWLLTLGCRMRRITRCIFIIHFLFLFFTIYFRFSTNNGWRLLCLILWCKWFIGLRVAHVRFSNCLTIWFRYRNFLDMWSLDFIVCAMLDDDLVLLVLAIRSLSLEALHGQTILTWVLHRTTSTCIGLVCHLLLCLYHLHEMLLLLLAHRCA